jgi:hypothetical protein
LAPTPDISSAYDYADCNTHIVDLDDLLRNSANHIKINILTVAAESLSADFEYNALVFRFHIVSSVVVMCLQQKRTQRRVSS